MKWYMALNESGTAGEIGLHTRLAILSAQKHTRLEPVMLYTGDRNDFTRWLERRGVRVIDSEVPYADVIRRLAAEGRYWTATLGHWLRTNVCLVEREDEHVLYTDVDVLFLGAPDLSLKPRYFAAAPEFDPNSWNYFNAGVMVANVSGLREDYPAFERYMVERIERETYGFHDQIAYNVYYQGKWDRLPLHMNWKPYWGTRSDTSILHFHGPKLHAILSIATGTWNWDSDYGRQLGSLFAANARHYCRAVKTLLSETLDLPAADAEWLGALATKLDSYDESADRDRVDLSFTNFRMFPE